MRRRSALAAERGMAVIVNRPFDGGHLLRRLQGQALPPLAAELGCTGWAPLLLKWGLAHPAVSCAIPATTDPAHMSENLQALRGPLPDARQREALTKAIDRATTWARYIFTSRHIRRQPRAARGAKVKP